jgi:hypothetical protein
MRARAVHYEFHAENVLGMVRLGCRKIVLMKTKSVASA